MADAVERFCCRWHANKRTGGTLLVLVGDTGRGKSLMMRRAMEWCRGAAVNAWEAGHWGKCSPQVALDARWPEIVAELRAFNRTMLPDLFEMDLIGLDDIGAETDRFDAGVDALCQILTRRDHNWTIVTTNVPMRGNAAEKLLGWAEKWDARVANRLLRNSAIVDLDGAPSFSDWMSQQ